MKKILLFVSVISVAYLCGGCGPQSYKETYQAMRERERIEREERENQIEAGRKKEQETDAAMKEEWLNNQNNERQTYLNQHPELDEFTKECIEKKKVYKGMPLECAKIAWNDYIWFSRLKDSEGYEIWELRGVFYWSGYQSFTKTAYTFSCSDGKVVSWTEWGF